MIRTRVATAVLLVLVAVSMLALVSCSTEPPVETGSVIGRRFDPAHWEGGWRTVWRTEYRCRPGTSFDGKTSTMRCGTESVAHQVWEDHHEWVQDRWSLQLRNCDAIDDDGAPKCRTGWRAVTSAEYERYRVGVHYPDPR